MGGDERYRRTDGQTDGSSISLSDGPTVQQSDRGERLRVVGQPLRKVDAVSKVIGATKFADDLMPPG